MIRKLIFVLSFTIIASGFGVAQSFVKTSDLFKRSYNNYSVGQLNIIQDPSIDSLISRYILFNYNLSKESGHPGMDGFRIQIYSSSNINAREESNRANALFMSKFPDIISYPLYAKPGYFKIRVGDFRTKTEATQLFLIISKEFPDAYIVPDFINFPDLNKK
jgi:hypothetical protein